PVVRGDQSLLSRPKGTGTRKAAAEGVFPPPDRGRVWLRLRVEPFAHWHGSRAHQLGAEMVSRGLQFLPSICRRQASRSFCQRAAASLLQLFVTDEAGLSGYWVGR